MALPASLDAQRLSRKRGTRLIPLRHNQSLLPAGGVSRSRSQSRSTSNPQSHSTTASAQSYTIRGSSPPETRILPIHRVGFSASEQPFSAGITLAASPPKPASLIKGYNLISMRCAFFVRLIRKVLFIRLFYLIGIRS